jgi:hypothetical protein
MQGRYLLILGVIFKITDLQSGPINTAKNDGLDNHQHQLHRTQNSTFHQFQSICFLKECEKRFFTILHVKFQIVRPELQTMRKNLTWSLQQICNTPSFTLL